LLLKYLGLEFVLVWTAVLLKKRVAVNARLTLIVRLFCRLLLLIRAVAQVLCEDVPTLLQCARAIPALAWSVCLASHLMHNPVSSHGRAIAQV
jgi:hypothetical protein